MFSDDEAGNFNSISSRDGRIDERQERFAEFVVAARRQSSTGTLAEASASVKHADDARAHGIGKFIQPEMIVGAGRLP